MSVSSLHLGESDTDSKFNQAGSLLVTIPLNVFVHANRVAKNTASTASSVSSAWVRVMDRSHVFAAADKQVY